MLRWVRNLFKPSPVDGQEGYDRGYKNGTIYATNATPKARERRLQFVDPPMDDYDRGFAEAIRDSY